MGFRPQLTRETVADQNFQAIERELSDQDKRLTPLEVRKRASVNNDLATFDWDMLKIQDLFLEQLLTATLKISVKDFVQLGSLQPGAVFTLYVKNSTGAALVVSFTEEFEASAPSIPDTETQPFTFRVKDPQFTVVAATVLEY